ncbi:MULTISPECIES: hypothetical protein [Microbacterium]|uniref:hypothetical protein n=1 Tax=Microbacterium TaxID=33882 RepID=UPI001EF4B469|nr:hypothetical protein [Microbacterium aurum]MCG7413354.1 hypothetical protein [Microbacterium aurum]
MRKVVIGDRSVLVTHAGTEATEFGDIQRFRIEMSESDAVTHLSILRSSAEVDARVIESVLDAELLLGYQGSAESGLLRDPEIRLWRDRHRALIEEVVHRFKEEARALPPEPVSEIEQSLLNSWGRDDTT